MGIQLSHSWSIFSPKIFHSTVQKRKQNLNIFRLKNKQGVWITNSNEIKDTAINSFQSQLNGFHNIEADYVLDFIPPLITNDQNELLIEFPMIDEDYNVIESMNA